MILLLRWGEERSRRENVLDVIVLLTLGLPNRHVVVRLSDSSLHGQIIRRQLIIFVNADEVIILQRFTEIVTIIKGCSLLHHLFNFSVSLRLHLIISLGVFVAVCKDGVNFACNTSCGGYVEVC